MYLDRQHIATNLPFNTISGAQKPPFDSVTINVFKNDEQTYTSLNKFKLARTCNYILITLPNYARNYNPDIIPNIDTIIYLQTTILKPNDTNQCYIRFLNANPDTNTTYSIKLGCPNGEHLFDSNGVTNVKYLQNSGTRLLYEGTRVFSIIKNSKTYSTDPDDNEIINTTELIGIFELDLTRLGQYALLANKFDDIYFIDELAYTTPPIKLYSIPERNAYVRTINLSSTTISVNAQAAGNLTTNLNPYFIDNYSTISTCDIMNLDKISLLNNSTTTDSIYLSFDIYKQYSLLVFDSETEPASIIISLPPINERMPKRHDKAIVRVVNGNYTQNGITLSLGAHTADNILGYASGTTLAVNL